MEDRERAALAEGALAFEIITHFFANQVAYGHFGLDSVTGIISEAEGRAITLHGKLSVEIASTAEVMREQMRKASAHGGRPGRV